MSKPSVGRMVHYVSYGTPGGEYDSKCRAAVITEVGQWVTVEIAEAASFSLSEGRPIRTLTQWWYADACALSVHNPTGMFFNGAGSVACKHDEETRAGGTWHWPEYVE